MLDSQGFDLWAEQYDGAVQTSDEDNTYPFAGYKNLMNAIYGTVMKKSLARVLDVGLGTGMLAGKLYNVGNTITGIDFSEKMLALARQKMPDATLIAHDFSAGLPAALQGAQFDVIISTYALHHLTDDAKPGFIRQLLAHLAKDAVLLIGDVSFLTRAGLEACKTASGAEWDDEEYYFIVEEIGASLPEGYQLQYHPFSFCAGVLEICRQ